MPKICQDIKDINVIFDQLTTSRSRKVSKTQPRLYFVIDSRTNMIGLTSDKNHASSLGKVVSWINESTQKILSSGSVKREEIRNLRDRYSAFVKLLPEATLFQKILKFLFGYKAAKDVVKEIVIPLTVTWLIRAQGGIGRSYGKRERQKVLVREYSGPKEYKKCVKKINAAIDYAHFDRKKKVNPNFEQINALKELEKEDITRAFDDELVAKLELQFGPGRAMHKLVVDAFEDALNQCEDLLDQYQDMFDQYEDVLNQFSDGYKRFSQELLTDFKLQLKLAIEKRNHISESIDRDTFRDFIAHKVKDGKGKLADDIDLSSPQVRKLINEYNKDIWRAGEERVLKYDVMDTAGKEKLRGILEPIINSKAFDAAILKYFESLKKV